MEERTFVTSSSSPKSGDRNEHNKDMDETFILWLYVRAVH